MKEADDGDGTLTYEVYDGGGDGDGDDGDDAFDGDGDGDCACGGGYTFPDQICLIPFP